MHFIYEWVSYTIKREITLFSALLFVLFAVFLLLGAGGFRVDRWAGGRRFIGLLTIVALGGYGALSLVFLLIPVFPDPTYAHIAMIASHFLHGHALYHGPGALEVYDLPYGPNLFFANMFFQKFLGPSFFSTKVAGVLAANASLFVLYCALRRQLSPRGAVFATGLAAAALLCIDGGPINNRDPFLCLFVAIGFLAASRCSMAGFWTLAIALGLGVNLKVHAVLYFVPVAAAALRHGYTWKHILGAVPVAVVVAVLPFLCVSGISWENYLWVLQYTAGHGLGSRYFLRLIEWFLLFAAPGLAACALALTQQGRSAVAALRTNRVMLAGTGLAFAVLLVPASKFGAGPHHLWPWVISLPILGAQLYHDGLRVAWDSSWRSVVAGAALFAGLLACYGTALANGVLFTGFDMFRFGRQVAPLAQDLQDIVNANEKDAVVVLGVSDSASHRSNFLQLYPIWRGMPIGVATGTVIDLKRVGYPSPDLGELNASLAAAAPSGQKRVLWVFQKGAEPFSLLSNYPPYDQVFDNQFQGYFKKHFTKVATTPYFDLYAQTAPSAPSAGAPENPAAVQLRR